MGNRLRPSHSRSRNHGCRITRFVYLGYEAITLENEMLRATLLPGKGSDVIEFLYKPLDVDFMWASRPGLQPAGAVKAASPASAFLDFYPGGWQEILPNFGEPCEYRGCTLGLHDEVSLLPWNVTVVEDHLEVVSVLLEVHCLRTPFQVRKTLTLRSGSELLIEEELTNDSNEVMDCTWGHHPAIGAPFLDEKCRIVLPPCRVKTQQEYVSPNSRLEKGQDCEWPMVAARNGGIVDLSRVPPMGARSHDMAYLYGLKQGWYVVFHDGRKVGFSLSWDANTFKYLWFWQVYGGWHGYPWYGTSYNIGLEPCTSYPSTLTGAIAAGTQLKFDPGQSRRTHLKASVVTKLEEFLAARPLVN